MIDKILITAFISALMVVFGGVFFLLFKLLIAGLLDVWK